MSKYLSNGKLELSGSMSIQRDSERGVALRGMEGGDGDHGSCSQEHQEIDPLTLFGQNKYAHACSHFIL